MLFKKSMIISAMLALATSSSVFAAKVNPLVTINNTDEYSTVLLDNGTCAGALGKHTRPGETLVVPSNAVWLICGDIMGRGQCGASIIMSPNEADMKSCRGEQVKVAGHATLNLPDMKIIKDKTSEGYSLDVKGNELTISKS